MYCVYMLQKLSIFNWRKAFMEEAYQFQAQQLVFGGGGNASSAVDEAYINGVCAGLSYRSLLTYGVYDPTSPDLVKMPKTEQFFALDDGGSGVAPPYTFFSDPASSSSVVDHHLPDLLSLELPPHNSSSTAVASGSEIPNPSAPYGGQRRRRPAQRLSDKTRCLQKLLPVDARMDIATVLEEAYKYINFLQAQISVLQSMPCDGSASPATYGIGGGDLGMLNRQQLLQVVLNSPVAQTQLYSQGCCLYSVEQLVLLKQDVERKALHHQMMMLGSTNPNSFLA